MENTEKNEKRIRLRKNAAGLARFVAFTVVVVLMYVWLSNMFVPYRKSSEDGMYNSISYSYRGEDKNSVDVFVVGNSDAYRAYSPVDFYKETGVTSAVSGVPKLTLGQAEKYISDMLKYQTPKVVVLETDCFFDTKNPEFMKYKKSSKSAKAGFFGLFTKKVAKAQKGSDEPTGITGAYKSAKAFVGSLDDALLTTVNYYYPLFKFHTQWSDFTKSDVNATSAYKYSNKGMAFSNKQKPYDGGYSYMGDPDVKPEDIDKKSLDTFERIYKLCQGNNIKLVFVTVPSAISWNYSKHYAIDSLAKAYDIEYTDYNFEPIADFDWTKHSKDGGDHMNYAGARKVTSEMAKMLCSTCDLKPTALTETQKAEWDEDYTYFHDHIVKPVGAKK